MCGGEVENDPRAMFAAVRTGNAVQLEHRDRLRSLIAIHHARSIQYYAAFGGSTPRCSTPSLPVASAYLTAALMSVSAHSRSYSGL